MHLQLSWSWTIKPFYSKILNNLQSPDTCLCRKWFVHKWMQLISQAAKQELFITFPWLQKGYLDLNQCLCLEVSSNCLQPEDVQWRESNCIWSDVNTLSNQLKVFFALTSVLPWCFAKLDTDYLQTLKNLAHI